MIDIVKFHELKEEKCYSQSWSKNVTVIVTSVRAEL